MYIVCMDWGVVCMDNGVVCMDQGVVRTYGPECSH